MTTFYKAEIKKANDALNQLSILSDSKQIVTLCGKIKAMKKKLVRGW
jgi:Holliday junction resolvase RusA-like endonuclease